MKTKYHCSATYDNIELISLLQNEKIKITDVNGTDFVFDFFSDTPQCDTILRCTKKEEHPLILKEAIFSKEEMQKAEWYTFKASRTVMETKKVDFTYVVSCPFPDPNPFNKHHHKTQINPFVSNKTPKWKANFNFCCTDTGDYELIFCSDHAKNIIIGNDIKGVEFLPVLKGDLSTPRENVQELMIPNILPEDALVLYGAYKEQICPLCGKVDIVFKDLNMDNLRVKKEKIPQGIDAFRTEITFGPGFGYQEIIISKKLYNLLAQDMKEKHITCFPVG